VDLVMAERQGTEIDYCPKCRGVWLDRGELDKIIEKSAAAGAPRHDDDRRHHDRDDDRYRDQRHGERPYRKKRESFLSDIFDF
jgi:hypothetical protein